MDRGPAAVAGGATTASTGLLALLGSPVAHSLSPAIHSAAIAAAGLDLVYLAFDVDAGAFPSAVAGLGALGARGTNVTVPHKRAALSLADDATAEARTVGAANTLWWEGGRLLADNTDAAGLQEVLGGDVGLEPGAGVVLFGAGGAALAAAVALGRLGARVEVVARRAEAAAEAAAKVTAAGGTVGEVTAPRMVVNATPLGLHGERLPDRMLDLGPGQVALDLLYGPVPTPFLATAAARGARAVDGMGMLVAQAARSFTRWTGVTPSRDAMRDAASAAVAASGHGRQDVVLPNAGMPDV